MDSPFPSPTPPLRPSRLPGAPEDFLAAPSLRPGFYAPPARPPLRMTPLRARRYARVLGALLVFAVLAAGLVYRAGGAGLNVPLISGGLLGLGFWRRPHLLRHRPVRLQLAVWAALAVAFVAHLDDWTTVSFSLATLLLSASVLSGAPDPLRALVRGAAQLICLPVAPFSAARRAWRWLRFRGGRGQAGAGRWLVPVAVAVTFGGLYVASNAQLSEAWSRAVAWVLRGAFWEDVLILAFLSLLFGVLGAGFLFVPRRVRGVLRGSFGESPPLPVESVAAWGTLSLTLLLVNALALGLNATDVVTTWLAEPSASGAVLKRGVHEGTWTLVVAIVAAVAVLGVGFRQNPPDFRRARALALGWLAQNAAMAATAALRNYHYTDAYGLTYKRIGVWLFLTCALAGLYLLGRKVRDNGGFEALVRRQSWAVYAVLAAAALPNWPGLMTRYNLSAERQQVDDAYLRGLLPYNFDTWADLRPRDMTDGTVPTYRSEYLRGPDGWRDWDYREYRRGRITTTTEVR